MASVISCHRCAELHQKSSAAYVKVFGGGETLHQSSKTTIVDGLQICNKSRQICEDLRPKLAAKRVLSSVVVEEVYTRAQENADANGIKGFKMLSVAGVLTMS